MKKEKKKEEPEQSRAQSPNGHIYTSTASTQRNDRRRARDRHGPSPQRMHGAPEQHSESSSGGDGGHQRSTKMAASSMESIGQKLDSLVERLEAVNNPPNIMLGVAGTAPMNGGGRTPRPQLPLDCTPRRINMRLPVTSTPNQNATETEMQTKLKLIRKQSGILTINNQRYPSQISDLERVSDLGSGTSGNVVKMRHRPTGTIIAVKQMRGTGNKEENNRIFMDLNVILNSHDCRYIVHCLGYFVNGQDVWICMELMSMCFDKLLKLSKKPVPEHILGKVTVATVEALSYLKVKHNVIHRDVKPSNILIDERGNIKLCDFGISGRLVDSKANTRSAGCAAYMAPERIDPRKPDYDIRADVWSLGIALIELATGSSPYVGCNIDFEVLTKILDNDPPSLPHGDGFNFSEEFRDFVTKCLTKNFLDRPKYPELQQLPFFRHYVEADINVAQWFKTVVESSGIETHRSHLPTSLRGDPNSKYNKSASVALASITAMPITTANLTANSSTINTTKSSQIPSYQNAQQLAQLQAAQSRYKRDDYLTHPHLHQYPAMQQPQHAPSQLPQPIASHYIGSSVNNHLQGERGGGGGSGSGSNSASNSNSPQSPPSIGAYKLPSATQQKDDHIVSEMNKLYKKSPFLQRKYSNGGAFKYSAESPKKESMLSSIGQSIIRNLTTSPFSQKKHSTPQPHQIDPLWRMPTVPDANSANAFDVCDANTNKMLTASPALARKRFQATATAEAKQQQQPSLIPINRNETNPQRVQGNHSPIVLQRFYHQQNQLRERELERQQQQQHHAAGHSPESTNPFLSGYQSPATTTQLHYNHYQLPHHQQQQQAHHSSLAASSSHSTSSQSSTQSSSSQIAVSELRHQRAALHSPTPVFGSSAGHLQYQPLPQQYLPLQSTLRNSRSPPTSPEQLSEGGATNSKLDKLYARRQLQSTTASSKGSGGFEGGLSAGNAKENNFKDENGWFNSLAGAMKRQFASYVKFQLNSSADSSSACTAVSTTQPSSNGSLEAASLPGKSALPYYRALSAGSSSNTSNSTSPTEALPKSGNGMARAADEFYDLNMGGGGGTSSSSFLRRYAAAGASGMNSAAGGANAQLFSGLDRRHRSPDPPPRYNRGQSPLLLRKNLLELSGQPPGSPLLNRRYISASPPLPPPRRGSESVPGSPQHFRTRIHYTPEPQRRIYRTIDQ